MQQLRMMMKIQANMVTWSRQLEVNIKDYNQQLLCSIQRDLQSHQQMVGQMIAGCKVKMSNFHTAKLKVKPMVKEHHIDAKAFMSLEGKFGGLGEIKMEFHNGTNILKALHKSNKLPDESGNRSAHRSSSGGRHCGSRDRGQYSSGY